MSVDLITALKDPNLLRSYLGDDLTSFRPWLAAMSVMIGRRVTSKAGRKLIRRCMGRDPDKLPSTPFDRTLILCGRRAGKSRLSAAIGAHAAVFSGREKLLSRGEIGLVAILAPTKMQANVTQRYLRAAFEVPMLSQMVVRETAHGFALKNNVEVQVLAGTPQFVRGFSLIACCIEECCHFQVDAEVKKKSDLEVIRAVTPGLLNTLGPLIAVSSPYTEAGWAFETWKRCWGRDDADTMVWRAPSREMNPTLSQAFIDAELAADPEGARSEYLAEWRQPISAFIAKEVVMACVSPGVTELMRRERTEYRAFADLSGGRHDDAVLAIGHRDGRSVVVDCIRRYRPPFSPLAVIKQMATELERWNIRRVTADYYAAEFSAQSFLNAGIKFIRSELSASQLYAELLPRLASREVELLDNPVLIKQLCGLIRHARPGSPEKITHLPNAHDDVANTVAGLCEVVATRRVRVGGL